MKFIKQLSEDEFVVKMEPIDADNTRRIVLAHDYLQITGRDWYCTDMSGLNAPWAYGNVINVHSNIQISIRMAQDILENVLTKDRRYLKKDHLVYSDGKSAYCDEPGTSYVYRTDEGIQMIAMFCKDIEKYVHIPMDLYETVKNNIKVSLENN